MSHARVFISLVGVDVELAAAGTTVSASTNFIPGSASDLSSAQALGVTLTVGSSLVATGTTITAVTSITAGSASGSSINHMPVSLREGGSNGTNWQSDSDTITGLIIGETYHVSILLTTTNFTAARLLIDDVEKTISTFGLEGTGILDFLFVATSTSHVLTIDPEFGTGFITWTNGTIFHQGSSSGANAEGTILTLTTSFTTGPAIGRSASDRAHEYVGINVAGADFGTQNIPGVINTDYTYPTNDELNYYFDKGMNTVRLPFRWERLQRTLNGDLDTAELNEITRCVNTCASRGGYTLLDPHNFGRRKEDGTPSSVEHIIGESNGSVTNAHYVDFWTKLTQAFVNQPKVIFGLLNEPHDQSTTNLRDLFNDCITAIRGVETSSSVSAHLILVPGNHFESALNWIGSDNDEILGPGIVDSADNWMFEVHQYLNASGSGAAEEPEAAVGSGQRLVNVTNWARAHGHQLFLGEFGIGLTSSMTTEGTDLMNYMTTNNDVWRGWTIWAGGPWWPSNYIYRITPDGSVGSYIDQPQMALLEPYIQQDLVISSSSSLIPGVASGGVSQSGQVLVVSSSLAITGTTTGTALVPGQLLSGVSSLAVIGEAGEPVPQPGTTITATINIISGQFSADSLVSGQLLSATPSLINGSSSGSATYNGETSSTSSSIISGEASGTIGGSTNGIIFELISSLIPGQGMVGHTAAGQSINAISSLTPGSASSSVISQGILINRNSSFIVGQSKGGGLILGTSIADNSSLDDGTATGESLALGQPVSCNVSLIDGAGQVFHTVSGVTITNDILMIPGSATGLISGTADGVTVSANSSSIAGSGIGGAEHTGTVITSATSIISGGTSGSQTVSGSIVVNTASMIVGLPSGAGIAPNTLRISGASFEPGSANSSVNQPGILRTINSMVLPGSATGIRNETAPGTIFIVTRQFLTGEGTSDASQSGVILPIPLISISSGIAQVGAVAQGSVITFTPSMIDGTASEVPSSTAPGVTIESSSLMIFGTAEGQATVQGFIIPVSTLVISGSADGFNPFEPPPVLNLTGNVIMIQTLSGQVKNTETLLGLINSE